MGRSASHQGVGGGDELFPAGPMHAKAKKKIQASAYYSGTCRDQDPSVSPISYFPTPKKKKKTARGGAGRGAGTMKTRGKENELTWIRENNAVDIYITKPSRSQFR
jgi:hypothetical protein